MRIEGEGEGEGEQGLGDRAVGLLPRPGKGSGSGAGMRARAVVIVRLRVWAGGWISPGSVTAQKPSLPDSSHWSTTSGVAAVELVAEGVLAAACALCGSSHRLRSRAVCAGINVERT